MTGCVHESCGCDASKRFPCHLEAPELDKLCHAGSYLSWSPNEWLLLTLL